MQYQSHKRELFIGLSFGKEFKIMRKAIYIITMIIFTSCVTDSDIRRLNNRYNLFKRDYTSRFDVKLLSHFPDTIKRDYITMFPLTNGKFTALIMTFDYDSHSTEIASIIKDSSIFHTKYSDKENIIINHLDLGSRDFIDPKCNIWYKDKYPIPYFDFVYFDMGAYKVKCDLFEGYSFEGYKFNVPKDLDIYVIEAKPGYYIKHVIKDKYTESLKEWEHGFSRGIAISKEIERIYYWTMIW